MEINVETNYPAVKTSDGILDYVKNNHPIALPIELKDDLIKLFHPHLQAFQPWIFNLRTLDFLWDADDYELIYFMTFFNKKVLSIISNAVFEDMSYSSAWHIIKKENLTDELKEGLNSIIWASLENNDSFESMLPKFGEKLKEIEQLATAKHINEASTFLKEGTNIPLYINVLNEKSYSLQWDYINVNNLTSGWAVTIAEFYKSSIEYLKTKQQFPKKPERLPPGESTLESMFTSFYREHANRFFEILKDEEFAMINVAGEWIANQTDCRAYFDMLKHKQIIDKGIKEAAAARIFKSKFGIREDSFVKPANPNSKKKEKMKRAIELVQSDIGVVKYGT